MGRPRKKAGSWEAELRKRGASRGYTLEKDGKAWYATHRRHEVRAYGEPGRGRRVPAQGRLKCSTRQRRTPDLRTVPAGEIWVGVIPADRPYIAIASRLDDGDAVIVCRFGASQAREMADELVRLAASIEASRN